jgi:hypothetical protein
MKEAYYQLSADYDRASPGKNIMERFQVLVSDQNLYCVSLFSSRTLNDKRRPERELKLF